MALTLPVINPNAFRYEISLDGRIYDLRVWWATDRGGPRLDLGVPGYGWLVQGVRMVRFWPLLYRLRHRLRPPGDIFLLERTSSISGLGEVTRDSLYSGRQIISYVTRAEINTIQPGTAAASLVRFVGAP